jgi:hypothetical protein
MRGPWPASVNRTQLSGFACGQLIASVPKTSVSRMQLGHRASAVKPRCIDLAGVDSAAFPHASYQSSCRTRGRSPQILGPTQSEKREKPTYEGAGLRSELGGLHRRKAQFGLKPKNSAHRSWIWSVRGRESDSESSQGAPCSRLRTDTDRKFPPLTVTSKPEGPFRDEQSRPRPFEIGRPAGLDTMDA